MIELVGGASVELTTRSSSKRPALPLSYTPDALRLSLGRLELDAMLA